MGTKFSSSKAFQGFVLSLEGKDFPLLLGGECWSPLFPLKLSGAKEEEFTAGAVVISAVRI